MEALNKKFIIQIIISVLSGVSLFLIIGLLSLFQGFVSDIHKTVSIAKDNNQNIIEINKNFNEIVETMNHISEQIQEIDERTLMIQENVIMNKYLIEKNSSRIDILYINDMKQE